MFGKPGFKAFIKIVGRTVENTPLLVSHPAVQISDAESETTQTARGAIRTQFAWFISLREPNPNGQFAGKPPILVLSRENIRFTPVREGYVEGLDAVAGTLLSVEDLQVRHGEQSAERQLAAAMTPVAITVDAIEEMASQA